MRAVYGTLLTHIVTLQINTGSLFVFLHNGAVTFAGNAWGGKSP